MKRRGSLAVSVSEVGRTTTGGEAGKATRFGEATRRGERYRRNRAHPETPGLKFMRRFFLTNEHNGPVVGWPSAHKHIALLSG
jgi:hypothetical protein